MASNIKNVWLENFEEELPIISELLDKYPYVAMVCRIFDNNCRTQSSLE